MLSTIAGEGREPGRPWELAGRQLLAASNVAFCLTNLQLVLPALSLGQKETRQLSPKAQRAIDTQGPGGTGIPPPPRQAGRPRGPLSSRSSNYT